MPRVPAPVAFGLSAVLHAAALVALARAPALARDENVAVEFLEVAPPPPPPRALPAAPARDAPSPRDAPPAPTPEAPPPPVAPPPEAAPARKAPVRIGISMSSSTSADGVAMPVGNTLYGEMPKVAPDPASVGAFHGERYVPPAQVTTPPRLVSGLPLPAEEYPEAARRLGFEGKVVLLLAIDETGAVREARVVEDPGHGLGEAAVRSVLRHFRFEPGARGSERVATTIRYTIWYELP